MILLSPSSTNSSVLLPQKPDFVVFGGGGASPAFPSAGWGFRVPAMSSPVVSP